MGSAVRSLMAQRTEWTGTASDLLGALSEEVSETVRRAKAWPAAPRVLSGRVRRAATFLRKVGIDISFDREGRARTRTIRISCTPDNTGIFSSAPSASSASPGKSVQGNGLGEEPLRTVTPHADANRGAADRPIVRKNPHDFKDADAADDKDAKNRSQSGSWRKRI